MKSKWTASFDSHVIYPVFTYAQISCNKFYLFKIDNLAGKANIFCELNNEELAIKLVNEMNHLSMGWHTLPVEIP